jgi:hypothetical protein
MIEFDIVGKERSDPVNITRVKSIEEPFVQRLDFSVQRFPYRWPVLRNIIVMIVTEDSWNSPFPEVLVSWVCLPRILCSLTREDTEQKQLLAILRERSRQLPDSGREPDGLARAVQR